MLEQWYKPLSESDRESLLNKVAKYIQKKKWEMPAVLFIESHRPLSNIGAHGLIALSPFLVPFLGFDNVRNFTRLMQDPENVERLLQKIETPELEMVKVENSNEDGH